MEITPGECSKARKYIGMARAILMHHAETDQYELSWYEAVTALLKAQDWTEDLRSAAKYDREPTNNTMGEAAA